MKNLMQQLNNLEDTTRYACDSSDLICFSHLRWNFVFQRPQHLMTRFAQHRRVFYFEEPVFITVEKPELRSFQKDGLQIVVPHFPDDYAREKVNETLRNMVDRLLEDEEITEFSTWYYTPMALTFSEHLAPKTITFDCMDELSAFKFAPPELIALEEKLMRKANVVFTGGQSLFEAKKHRHDNIHAFPSSIDFKHFAQARTDKQDPADQANIPHPRLGFFGVIDERMDIELLASVAAARPDWHLVMIGPVVKIHPDTLPKAANIHYLGPKDYRELPAYLGGWDVALLPFALNESTKFISPTKTPEYLAAGCPVVSTSIRDVVRPYGDEKLVHIADSPETFVKACEAAMEQGREDDTWKSKVLSFLKNISWDSTWAKMADHEKKCHKFTNHHISKEKYAQATQQ
ncbi:MAG: glycosyltransferase family 1 protein [Bdellovibrionota bacterium]